MTQEYKVWFIMLENVNYTADNLFNIASSASSESFVGEEPELLYNLWEKSNFKIEKKMIYNMHFLEKIESFLLKNGVLFNWIIYKGEYIGIRINPTVIDFNNLLIDSMTLEEFSKNRTYMNIKDKQ